MGNVIATLRLNADNSQAKAKVNELKNDLGEFAKGAKKTLKVFGGEALGKYAGFGSLLAGGLTAGGAIGVGATLASAGIEKLISAIEKSNEKYREQIGYLNELRVNYGITATEALALQSAIKEGNVPVPGTKKDDVEKQNKTLETDIIKDIAKIQAEIREGKNKTASNALSDMGLSMKEQMFGTPTKIISTMQSKLTKTRNDGKIEYDENGLLNILGDSSTLSKYIGIFFTKMISVAQKDIYKRAEEIYNKAITTEPVPNSIVGTVNAGIKFGKTREQAYAESYAEATKAGKTIEGVNNPEEVNRVAYINQLETTSKQKLLEYMEKEKSLQEQIYDLRHKEENSTDEVANIRNNLHADELEAKMRKDRKKAEEDYQLHQRSRELIGLNPDQVNSKENERLDVLQNEMNSLANKHMIQGDKVEDDPEFTKRRTEYESLMDKNKAYGIEKDKMSFEFDKESKQQYASFLTSRIPNDKYASVGGFMGSGENTMVAIGQETNAVLNMIYNQLVSNYNRDTYSVDRIGISAR